MSKTAIIGLGATVAALAAMAVLSYLSVDENREAFWELIYFPLR